MYDYLVVGAGLFGPAFIIQRLPVRMRYDNKMPITEDMPQRPINPYGASKLMVERILEDYEHAELIGSNVKAREVLGWVPRYSDIETILYTVIPRFLIFCIA